MKRFFFYPTFLFVFIFGATLLPGTRTPVASQDLPSGYLILNEISPWPSDDQVWVEFLNPANQPVVLDGYRIEFLSGFTFTFPEGSGEIAGGNRHMLNISGGNPLNHNGDGCILSSPDGPVDAIWWGTPPDGSFLPLPVGPPIKRILEVIREDNELYPPDWVCMRFDNSWFIREPAAASPGEHNPSPGPVGFAPTDGAVMASDFSLYVHGMDWADSITFQIASDAAFTCIVLDETTSESYVRVNDLDGGDYYWRVRGNSESWSPVYSFTREPFDIDDLIARQLAQSESSGLLASNKAGGTGAPGPEDLPIAPIETLRDWRVIGVSHLTQRKDTMMVCLDGCRMDGDWAWDVFHPNQTPPADSHGRCNCSRACIAMIARHFGCNLTQDRIAYHIFEEAGSASASARDVGHLNDPFKDLGHDTGTYVDDIIMALGWLYNQGPHAGRSVNYSQTMFDDHDPSDLDSVRDYIDDDRPVIWDVRNGSNEHSKLIDGYAYIESADGTVVAYAHTLDPWTPDETDWESIFEGPRQWLDFPPPAGTPSRSDEDGILLDDDGDGLVNFDETERLETNPGESDSDDDGIDDKIDMLGYLFRPDGEYHLRDRDFDGDGKAKELDIDNDNSDDNGMPDGCEDANRNGFMDGEGHGIFPTGPIETDNFDASDDFSEQNIECYRGSIRIEGIGLLADPYSRADLWEEIRVWGGHPLDSEEFLFEHRWGIRGHAIVETYEMIIEGFASGVGEGSARVTIEIDDDGHYTITTDTRPTSGSYTVITTGGSANTFPIYFGLGSDTYAGVPADAPPMVWNMIEEWGPQNVFEGEVEQTEMGGFRLAGTDTITAPFAETFYAGSTRTWEIWLTPEIAPP